MYKISLEKPIFMVWAGEYINDEGTFWKHKSRELSAEFEVILPTTGELNLLVNEKRYIVQQDECLIISPYSNISSDVTTDKSISFYWLHFLADWQIVEDLDPSFKNALEVISRQQVATSINNTVLLPDIFQMQNPISIHLLFRQLLTAMKTYKYSERSNDFFTSLILCSLSNDYLKHLALLHSNKPSKTEYIAEWIRVHLSDDITVKQIADHFEMNPNYLTRLFHQEQGISVKEYILLTKLEHAKYLLTTTIAPIREIAELSFFGDAKHFMRIFKQKVGITPSTYRKEYSKTRMNSKNIDPSDPLPTQFGTKALKNMIKSIFED